MCVILYTSKSNFFSSFKRYLTTTWIQDSRCIQIALRGKILVVCSSFETASIRPCLELPSGGPWVLMLEMRSKIQSPLWVNEAPQRAFLLSYSRWFPSLENSHSVQKHLFLNLLKSGRQRVRVSHSAVLFTSKSRDDQDASVRWTLCEADINSLLCIT